MFSTNLVSSNLNLQIRRNKISDVEIFKLLFVKVDLELKFHEHVSNIFKKVNQNVLLSPKIDIFSVKFNEILFKSIFLIHFDNCSSLFISINQTSFLKPEECFTIALNQVLCVRVSR